MIIQMLMNQIKMKNPKMFNQVEDMMKNNNPQDVLNKIMSGYTPEQRQQFIKYANVTSATAGNVALGIFADGTQVAGTEMDTPVTVGVYTNVSSTKYIRVCGRGNVSITVRSIPSIIYDGTTTATQIPIVKNANISIKRYA